MVLLKSLVSEDGELSLDICEERSSMWPGSKEGAEIRGGGNLLMRPELSLEVGTSFNKDAEWAGDVNGEVSLDNGTSFKDPAEVLTRNSSEKISTDRIVYTYSPKEATTIAKRLRLKSALRMLILYFLEEERYTSRPLNFRTRVFNPR